MWIYIINFVLIIYWWCLYVLIEKLSLKRNSINQNVLDINKPIKEIRNFAQMVLLFLPFLQIYLLLSFKKTSVGTDTKSYIEGFNLIKTTPWELILNLKLDNLIFNFERGFIFLSKSITLITDEFTVYAAIIYAIMIVPLYKVTKRYSRMPFLSLILFITLGFLNFYISGMRQAIAMSLIFLSFNYIVNRKFLKFLLLVMIAALIHKSAVFFIPAYFIINITFSAFVILLYFFVLFATYLFRYQIFEIVLRFFYTDVEIVSTGAYTLLLIVIMTFVVGLVTYKQSNYKDPNLKILYNIIAISTILMIFNTISNVGLRVANYYYIFMILFIPNIIASYNHRLVRMTAIVLVIGFTLIYYLRIGVSSLNGTPYNFFWQ
jgi:hypothetical protein